MKTRDVLGFGCTTIDELLYVDEWPDAERKLPIRRLETQGGGLGATALIAAARLGASCAYAGLLGHDETSKRVAKLLEVEGIDLDLVAWHEDAGAIRAFVIVDTSRGTRNIFFLRPELVGTPFDCPEESEIAASRCVFLDHYGGQGNVRVCELARKHGVPVVADFERSDVPDWNDFFPLVSHPILSRGFASRLTGEDEEQQMARALWNANREAVIVTCGEDGCYSTGNGREVAHFLAFATEVVDTTGCGDCFHGVYCAALAWGWPLEQRIEWASAAASLKARVVGAQKGLPSREEVEAFLASPSERILNPDF
jgi:sulfofructose kinase